MCTTGYPQGHMHQVTPLEPSLSQILPLGDVAGVAFAQRPGRGRYVRRSDTNILAVKFNKLIEPSDVHTGDPVLCGNQSCLAVLSHLSSVVNQEGKDEKVKGQYTQKLNVVEPPTFYPAVGV